MKTKILFLLFGVLSILQAFAIQAPTYGVYPTREAFDASGEGNVCQVVTDGCSEFNITETGSVGDPIKSCKVTADFKFAWTCKEGKSNIYYFGGEPTPVPTPVIVGGDKDVHGCIGAAGYTWDIVAQMCAHPWEDGYGMTKEDRDEMQGIKDALDTDSQNKVSNAIANYKIKLFELHSGKDAWQVNMSVLKGITAKLKEVQSSIRPGYGMITKTLSDKINMLKLVRFHLMQVSNQLAYDVKNAK